MRLYKWRARSSGGKTYQGEYFAEDEKAVIAFIHANYGYVTGIKETGKNRSVGSWFRPRHEFTDKERAIFFRQLYTLLEAGIPITKAIRMLAPRLGEKYGPVCSQIFLSLREGQPLSQAMERMPEIFSGMCISVVEAGEVSGQLNAVLKSMADFYKKQDQMHKFVRNVCMYPMFLLTLSCAALAFFSINVLPLFADLYQTSGVQYSRSLELLLSVSVFMQDHTVALSCALVIACKIVHVGRKKLLTVLWHFPVIRQMRHTFLEIRFEKLLALMLMSGIAVPEAIMRAAAALEDEIMREQAKMFSESVTRGIGITEAALQSGDLLGKTGIAFLSIGENSGNLPDMLKEAAGVQEQDLFACLRDFKTILEPVLVVMVAGVVFAVVAMMLSPLFTLMAGVPEYN